MKKVKNIICMILVIGISLTSINGFAQQGSITKTGDTKTGDYEIELTEDIIQKADKYVELNQSTNKFVLNKDAYDVLTKNEIKIVLEAITQGNVAVQNLYKDDIKSIKTNGNYIEIQEFFDSSSSEINLSRDAGINKTTTHWWGTSAYYSKNRATEVVLDYRSARTFAAGVTIATAGSPLAAFTIPVGLTGAYWELLADRIERHNVSGRGVIVNLTWVLAFTVKSQ